LGVRFSKEEEQTKKWLVSIAEDNGYKVIEEENFVAVFKPNEIKSL
jgi:metal-dependent amidase/aminoacylase/carboxypeptidase family protein